MNDTCVDMKSIRQQNNSFIASKLFSKISLLQGILFSINVLINNYNNIFNSLIIKSFIIMQVKIKCMLFQYIITYVNHTTYNIFAFFACRAFLFFVRKSIMITSVLKKLLQTRLTL